MKIKIGTVICINEPNVLAVKARDRGPPIITPYKITVAATEDTATFKGILKKFFIYLLPSTPLDISFYQQLKVKSYLIE